MVNTSFQYVFLLCLTALTLSGCGAPPSVTQGESEIDPQALAVAFVINSNATHTNSLSANLSIVSSGLVPATEMYITNDITCVTGGTWETFANTKAVTLANANSTNVLAIKVRNATEESNCATASIVHDNINPIISFSAPVSGTWINLSNVSNFAIGGTCTENATVAISGAMNSSAACASSVWARNLNLSAVADGAVNLSAVPTDLAGNVGASADNSFMKDTVAPTLSLTSPVSGSVFNASNVNNVTFSGLCSEDTRNVVVSGAFSDTIVCTSGSWSKAYDLSTVADGAFVLNFNHQDVAGNTAVQVTANYTKDSSLPTLTIVNPVDGIYLNAANHTSVTINGACSENGQNVVLSGAISQTVVCASGAWSLNYDFSAVLDGALNIVATHADVAGNVATADVDFNKDVVAPGSPSISIASGASSTTSLNVVLSLSALDASEMYVTNTAACASGGVYEAFAASKNWVLPTADANNIVYVKYRDLAGNESACVSDDILHTTTPPTLTFDNPVNGTWVNLANRMSFSISGTCSENGQNVVISGAASMNVACTSNAWSANVNVSATSDGVNSVSLTVNHSSAGGLSATPVTRTFSKDTVSPAAPVITNPPVSPYTSSTSPLAITGTCESGATVSITGAQTLSPTCSSGTFSTNFTQGVDGSYSYTLTQIDVAGNTSASSNFAWEKDSSIPAAPVLTSPVPNPHFSNLNSVVIAGSCVTGNDVEISGDLIASDVTSPAGSLIQVCASNAFSFTVQKTSNATYNFSVFQTNTAGTDSPSVNITWTRDTVAPAAPVITTPPTSPYTAGGNLLLSGTCESMATVNVSGDDTQSVACAGGNFSFTINKSVDATYNFTVTQTDRAGNVSVAANQQWVRDSSVLPAPVITNPSVSPITTADTALTVQGTCVAGYTVSIASGALASEVVTPANSLTQTCVGGNFEFLINKSTDATYNFTFTQTDGFTVSPTASQQWTRDTLAPTTTISAQPTNPNYRVTASFTFSANEPGSDFECNLDSSGWTTCTSPLSLSGLTNTNHTLEIRAIDPYGNIEAVPASYTWTQQAYNTIALYKFDSGAELSDSGLYSGGQNNPLTNTGSTSFATGFFNEARQFVYASSQSAATSDKAVVDLMNEVMTIDMRVRFDTLLGSNNQYIILASKNGASGQMSWEFGLKRVSGTYRITFRGSLNGTTMTERRASTACAVNTTAWHHIAVTWNRGSLRFFCNGTSVGTGTIGTAGSAVLFNSNADLRIARTQTLSSTYQSLNGKLDEVRFSQIVRWTANFTPSASAYTPD